MDFLRVIGNQSQRAYSHIRGKLLEGSVAPGTRLAYGPIGKEIGVSATPVREAVASVSASMRSSPTPLATTAAMPASLVSSGREWGLSTNYGIFSRHSRKLAGSSLEASPVNRRVC